MNSSACMSHLPDNYRYCLRSVGWHIFTCETNSPLFPKALKHWARESIYSLSYTRSKLHSSEVSKSKLPTGFKFIFINISYLAEDPLNILKVNLYNSIMSSITYFSKCNPLFSRHPYNQSCYWDFIVIRSIKLNHRIRLKHLSKYTKVPSACTPLKSRRHSYLSRKDWQKSFLVFSQNLQCSDTVKPTVSLVNME